MGLASAKAKTDAQTLTAALGARIRALRTDRGWSQFRLAELAVEAGLVDWRRPLIANLEAGHRRLDLGETLVLASVFGVPLVDLLPTERLLVTEHSAMTQAQLRWFLTGGLDGTLGARHVYLDTNYLAWLLAHAPDRQEATAKAARALGISEHDLVALAKKVWGTSLPAERDRRLAEMPDAEELSARSRQARRGHITRVLLSELRGHMTAAKRPTRARQASSR
jgi:transcriptional regulator with XRE-family HTH domain